MNGTLATQMKLLANSKQIELENQQKQMKLREYNDIIATIKRCAENGHYHVRVELCHFETYNLLTKDGFKVEKVGVILYDISWE